MKAIDSIRNKIKKPSRTTVLFWFGWSLGPLAFVLQLVFPSAWLTFDIVAVCSFALSGSQKIVGDCEQGQQLEQERKRNEAVAQNRAIHSTELRIESNVKNRAPDTMPIRESQFTQRRDNA